MYLYLHLLNKKKCHFISGLLSFILPIISSATTYNLREYSKRISR